ncbi:GNAT family N-acetyltransferase [Dictyobacter aurantiacus]|uniref:N-acetyltransferase domain-containing protein n=1 Tax=Dictyobacter aurantiacus TaxID=1936993 RepID=A0A401ZSL0_9CHLR|nr:GNAT family N-acetyltransferase [Dictyobacter aurantiacus]GCE09770.1 hypothetical protein KDAU_70990 [Dictyobacter aurantiacus]
MAITRHPFDGTEHLTRVLELVRQMPESCRHVVDWPWRMSSPAIHAGNDAVFWENEEGMMVGLAAWQYYWAVLDFFIRPGPQQSEVEKDLFAWADQRFRERDVERGQPLPYWAEFQEEDRERQQLVNSHGFRIDEYDCYVYLEHALENLPPVPTLPEGFMLRTLRGVDEVAAYADLHSAAFESNSMTPEWRARTLRMPTYRPELDLVIEAPDGSLAGFCVGWLESARQLAQIEPIGVHPRFQQLGLSRVMLLEILHRFRQHGARKAIVETNLDRSPARHAYAAAGFQQTHIIHSIGKWVNPRVGA